MKELIKKIPFARELIKIPFVLRLYNFTLRLYNFVLLVPRRFKIGFGRSMNLFRGKTILEVGGPSAIFQKGNLLPVYPVAQIVDNCNFAAENFWSAIQPGRNFRFDWRKECGRQYILDGTHLHEIGNERYDAVICSHVLEHLANPLKGVSEWRRVLKENGVLLMVVPHRDGAYDRRRQVTAMQHIVDDFISSTPENDATHFEDVLQNHDLSRDTTVLNYEAHRERTIKNATTRIVHHHVFSSILTAQILDYAQMGILTILPVLPHHIITLSRRSNDERARSVNNAPWLAEDHPNYLRSPFPSDRLPSVPTTLR